MGNRDMVCPTCKKLGFEREMVLHPEANLKCHHCGEWHGVAAWGKKGDFNSVAGKRLTRPTGRQEVGMEWKELPQGVRDTMEELGDFTPTVHSENREVKGYMLDEDGAGGSCYYNSLDLRRWADHLVIVADWLDKRATTAAATPPSAVDLPTVNTTA